jgi:hypothetical protein
MNRKSSNKRKVSANTSLHVTNGEVTPLSSVNFHLTIFSIFLGLTFAYFVYFSHQITDAQSEMVAKITEINAINIPYPFQFLTISGHKEYHYTKRRDALREEFRSLKRRIDELNLSESELAKLGKEIQRVITQIAYFFPYKRMLEFKQNGSCTFDPNKHESIDTKEKINLGFLKTQIDEIYNWNYAFTLPLKDGSDRISKAVILAGGFKDEYTKSRVVKYLESLVSYLEKHYELTIPLGLLIKKYEYLTSKTVKSKIVLFTILLGINFLCGVLFPLFWIRLRNNMKFEILTQASFVLGIILLFKEALYSLPF